MLKGYVRSVSASIIFSHVLNQLDNSQWTDSRTVTLTIFPKEATLLFDNTMSTVTRQPIGYLFMKINKMNKKIE